eukprot:413599-Amorphochlora_amoeboformis.AAC.1
MCSHIHTIIYYLDPDQRSKRVSKHLLTPEVTNDNPKTPSFGLKEGKYIRSFERQNERVLHRPAAASPTPPLSRCIKERGSEFSFPGGGGDRRALGWGHSSPGAVDCLNGHVSARSLWNDIEY